MNLTMKNVLKLDVIHSAKVYAGENQLNQCYVEGITVIEIPVEDFVKKNEVVLTTGIGINEDLETFLDFVKEIRHSHAAGLIFATGRHVHQIPQEVIDYAQKHEFPLIEIPWSIRFSDIIQSVLSRLNDWQHSLLQVSEKIQNQLLHHYIQKSDLSTVAKLLHKHLDYPILIVDNAGMVRGESPHATLAQEAWNQYLLSTEKSLFDDSIPQDWQPHLHYQLIHLEKMNILQLAIGHSRVTDGYLLVSLPIDNPIQSFLDQENSYLLENAITVIALWFQREQLIHETEMRLRGDFVLNLAKNKIESTDVANSQARSLHYNINLPYVCILGYPEKMEKLFHRKKLDQTPYEHWLQRIVQHIDEQIWRVGKKLHRELMVTYHADQFIIFLEVQSEHIHSEVNHFLDLLEQKLKHYYPELLISWGIGENHVGEQSFHESFTDASIALDIGRRQKLPSNRNTSSNTGLYRALQSLIHNHEIQEIAHSTIDSLLRYDQLRKINLIQTLSTYIRNNGNISQTAREMNLHRQSLLYRLHKIESLTNRSLINPDDLFLLDISVRLWSIGVIDL